MLRLNFFLFSVFFSRTKTGLIAGFLFFFILYIVNALVGTNEVPDSTKIWASLSSHAAMSFSSDSFLVAEVFLFLQRTKSKQLFIFSLGKEEYSLNQSKQKSMVTQSQLRFIFSS